MVFIIQLKKNGFPYIDFTFKVRGHNACYQTKLELQEPSNALQSVMELMQIPYQYTLVEDERLVNQRI